MAYSSQPGFVGIRTQASKGSYADPAAVAPNQGVYVRTRSGALGGNRDLLIPDAEIGGNRDIPDAQLGPIAFSGSYDMYVRMESLATFLYGALGAKAADTGTALLGYTHTITPGNTIPWMSVDEQVGSGFMNFNYTDAKVNTLHLEADANGYLMGTAGLIALTQTVDATPTAFNVQRWDTSGLIVGTSIVVNWNGAQLPAKSFSLDINNNLENNDFRLGSLFLGNLQEKRREVTMGVKIRPEDASYWKAAMYGSPVATVAGGRSYKAAASITITSYEDIVGATAPQKYVATFTIPQAIIKPFTPNPSGDDVLEHDLELQLVRPDPAVDLLSVTVKNSYATVA